MNITRVVWVTTVAASCVPVLAQTTFTRWDFNASGLSETSPAPAFANQGNGTALMIGGTAAGSIGAFVADNGGSDVGTGSAWNIGNFPPQGTASGTGGVEFRTDATGYSNLSFEFDLRTTGTFSDFIRVQYSLDHGATWTSFTANPIQLPGNTNASATVWNNNLGSGTGGQPLFALPPAADGLADVRARIVTVFDPALGNAYSPNSPTNGAGAPQSYQTSGAVRFDMVEFKGAVSQGVPPSIAMSASGVTPTSSCAGSSPLVNIDLAVLPGSVPVSTSITATADTSSIGGSASVAMTPMGVDLSGRWLFHASATAGASTPVGARPIALSVTDNLDRTASGTLWLAVSVCCPADLDNGSGAGTRDGGVDVNDLLFFLAKFELGTIDADLDNGSGTGTRDGGVDINDLLFFLVHFEAGC